MAGKKRTYQDIELPEGVRVRGKSLQIAFSWSGEQQQITIKMEPNARNIAYAGGLVQTVKREIDLNLFEWEKHFPEHKYAKNVKLALPDSYLIANLLDNYIMAAEKDLSGLTWDHYSYSIATVLKPAFGHIPVADFSAGHVRQWIKEQTLARTTLKKYLAPLRSALREAFLDEKIAINPLRGFAWPKEPKALKAARLKKRDESGDLDPFNRAEIDAILDACQNRPQEQNMIRFAFWSGVRLEELFALQWRDVDFINGSIRVQRALVKRKGYKANGKRAISSTEIKGLKTDDSGIRQRDVILMPEALKALTDQKPHTLLMNLWIFHNPFHNSHWQSTNQFYNRWRVILPKAGVRHRQPYQIRHTWASMMLAAQEDESWVAKMLGHVDTTMVRKVYRRFIHNGIDTGGYRFRNDWGQGRDIKECEP